MPMLFYVQCETVFLGHVEIRTFQLMGIMIAIAHREQTEKR
jgi:hypothetical protein